MIFYLDFSSVGDASFYRSQWEISLNKSNKRHYRIYTDLKYSLNRKYISIPQNFSSNNHLNNLIKFISQSSIVLLLAIWVLLSRKNNVIIFNLHQPFVYWRWLKILKKNSVKVIGIIHDIIQFDTSQYPQKIISSNKKIISELDAVILHSGESLFQNEYYFTNKIYTLKFPQRQPYKFQPSILNFQYFLLPGRYRKEKGFDFVIKNWPHNNSNIPLVVMTKVPSELEAIIKLNKNIVYRPNLSTTESFENLIMNCTASILMYTDGTNSGILQTLIANQKKVITSNIPAFTEHIESDNFIFCEFQRDKFQRLISNFNLSNYSKSYSMRNENELTISYINFLNQIS